MLSYGIGELDERWKESQGKEEIPVHTIFGYMLGIIEVLDGEKTDCAEDEKRDGMTGCYKQTTEDG